MTSGQSSGARGLSRVRIGARSGAIRVPAGERRAEVPPLAHRSDHRRVVVHAVDHRGSAIQGETAIAGSRTPSRSNVKPIWPAGAAGSGGVAPAGNVVVGAAVLVEHDHQQRVAASSNRGVDDERIAS